MERRRTKAVEQGNMSKGAPTTNQVRKENTERKFEYHLPSLQRKDNVPFPFTNIIQ